MTTEVMVKTLAKLNIGVCIGGMLLAIGGLLENKEVKKLKDRVLTLEAQVMNLKAQEEIWKKIEETAAVEENQ